MRSRQVVYIGTLVFLATRCSALANSPSQSPSGRQTPSASRSQDETHSASASLSSSSSGSASPSSSPSQSESGSQSASQTATPSASGFPVQSIIDNTLGLSALIDVASCPVSTLFDRAVSFYMPEVDPACGPAQYRLVRVTLPISLNASQPRIAVVQIMTADSTSFLPVATVWAAILPFPSISASPSYITFSLPSTWTIDTLYRRNFAVSLYSDTLANWHYTLDSVPGHVPAPGFGRPSIAAVSANTGGSWTPEAPYPGLVLYAQKLACSPSPSQRSTPSVTPSVTQSSTTSRSQTRSGSLTRSPSRTASQTSTLSGTPSATVSQASSPSLTPSVTRSPTETATETLTQASTYSQAATPSGSQAETCSQSPTISGSRSQELSQTVSPTQTTSGTGSASSTASESKSQSSSASSSPSQSVSLTPSRTGTRSSTASRTPSRSQSRTQTASLSQTPSQTPSGTGTPSASPSQRPTPSLTTTISPTASRSPSSTATLAASPSITVTGSTTQSSSPTQSATSSDSGTTSQSFTPSKSGTTSRTGSSPLTATASLTRSCNSSLAGGGAIACGFVAAGVTARSDQSTVALDTVIVGASLGGAIIIILCVAVFFLAFLRRQRQHSKLGDVGGSGGEAANLSSIRPGGAVTVAASGGGVDLGTGPSPVPTHTTEGIQQGSRVLPLPPYVAELERATACVPSVTATPAHTKSAAARLSVGWAGPSSASESARASDDGRAGVRFSPLAAILVEAAPPRGVILPRRVGGVPAARGGIRGGGVRQRGTQILAVGVASRALPPSIVLHPAPMPGVASRGGRARHLVRSRSPPAQRYPGNRGLVETQTEHMLASPERPPAQLPIGDASPSQVVPVTTSGVNTAERDIASLGGLVPVAVPAASEPATSADNTAATAKPLHSRPPGFMLPTNVAQLRSRVKYEPRPPITDDTEAVSEARAQITERRVVVVPSQRQRRAELRRALQQREQQQQQERTDHHEPFVEGADGGTLAMQAQGLWEQETTARHALARLPHAQTWHPGHGGGAWSSTAPWGGRGRLGGSMPPSQSGWPRPPFVLASMSASPLSSAGFRVAQQGPSSVDYG